MELLVSLLISSIIFLGMCFIITETSQHHAYEDIKLDSKVFANYVLDDMSQSIRLADVVLYNNNAII